MAGHISLEDIMTYALNVQATSLEVRIDTMRGGGDALRFIYRNSAALIRGIALAAGTPLLGLAFVIALPLVGFAALLLAAVVGQAGNMRHSSTAY